MVGSWVLQSPLAQAAGKTSEVRKKPRKRIQIKQGGVCGWVGDWLLQRPLAQAAGKTSPCKFLVVTGREAWRGYLKG